MHICIPDTREVRPASGSAYLLYNVHIDGLYHCSLRYKQLHHLHQALSKRFPSGANLENVQLPQFPPKKLLPLTQSQVEDRRQALEKYLQNISQDKQISNSSLFNMYLLEAQRESSSRLVDANKHVHLDIELVNGAKIRLSIVSQDSVDSILTACCRSLGLADQYHAYFCLCLCGYDVVSDKLIIKRRLSFFEAPFITLQMAIQQQEQLQSVLSSSNGLAGCGSSASNGAANHHHHNHHYYQSNHNHLNQHHHYHSSNQNNSQHHKHNHQQLTTNSSPSTTTTNLNNNSSSSPCRCLSCSQVPHAISGSSSSSVTANPDRCTCCDVASSMPDNSQQVAAVAHVNKSSRGSFVTHRILLRKSYWDPIYDSYILSDSQALSLLFIQTVYDMKHSLMFVNRATYHRLESLLASDSKLEYILLARTLKYYNYVHFEPCYSDYPRPRTKVMISIGSKELNMRVLKQPPPASPSQQPRVNGHHNHLAIPSSSSSTSTSRQDQQNHQADQEVLYCTSSLASLRGPQRQLVTKEDLIEEEYNFKVPLIRCWRLTSLETLNPNGHSMAQQTGGRHAHQPHAATTTALAGGKRKSLSLFNSVLGNSNSSSNSTAGCGRPGTNGHSQRHDAMTTTRHRQPAAQAAGVGGASLMATLMGHHASGDAAISSNSPATTGGSHPQSQQQNGSATSSDSFHCFSSNLNQTTTTTSNNYHSSSGRHNCDAHEHHHQAQLSQYELSFEYLIDKDTLKWITISSDQAIFISISLQGVVDELVSRREMGAIEVTAAAAAATAGNGPTTNLEQLDNQLQNMSLAPPVVVSRPIAIAAKSHRTSSGSSPRQLAQSFTYLYRDGAQKNIKAKSQQQLIDRFCSGVGGASGAAAAAAAASLSSSAPSTSYVLANTGAYAARQRNQSEREANSRSHHVAPSSSSFISSTPSARRSSLLQVASLWGSSPPGRYYGHQSSSGNYGGGAYSTGGVNGGVVPFEFGHHYHCNTRHAANGSHTSKCKAPSPIINDAFEGVVSNDDDF